MGSGYFRSGIDRMCRCWRVLFCFFVLIMVLFHLWQLSSCDCFSLVRLNFFSSTFVGWLCVCDWPTCNLCLKSFP